MDNFCNDHRRCLERLDKLEQGESAQWKQLDTIKGKLNFIIGGIIISPFIVALITLLIFASSISNIPKG